MPATAAILNVHFAFSNLGRETSPTIVPWAQSRMSVQPLAPARPSPYAFMQSTWPERVSHHRSEASSGYRYESWRDR